MAAAGSWRKLGQDLECVLESVSVCARARACSDKGVNLLGPGELNGAIGKKPDLHPLTKSW